MYIFASVETQKHRNIETYKHNQKSIYLQAQKYRNIETYQQIQKRKVYP